MIEFGLTEERFWRLTPAFFAALINQKRQFTKREDYRTGVLTMVVRAVAGGKNAGPFDFFPEHKEAQTQRKTAITSAETVRANMRAYIEGQKAYGAKKEGG